MASGPPAGKQAEVGFDVPDPWLEQNPWIEDDDPVIAVYQKKHGAPDVFEFRHYRKTRRHHHRRAGPVPPSSPKDCQEVTTARSILRGSRTLNV